MSDETILSTNPVDASGTTAIAHLLKHMREPQNLLTYMVFTAWCKFMGVAQFIPTITIG